jgi:hypothetical protein
MTLNDSTAAHTKTSASWQKKNELQRASRAANPTKATRNAETLGKPGEGTNSRANCEHGARREVRGASVEHGTQNEAPRVTVEHGPQQKRKDEQRATVEHGTRNENTL